MKKTKINLLRSKIDYQKIEQVFYWLRISVFGSIIIFISIITFFLIVFLNQNSVTNKLLEAKKTLLESLKDKEADEAKVLYIQNKYNDLTKFMNEDDAKSLPYYNLLNTALLKSSESATLKSFVIEKNREVNFSVGFVNFSELLSFFRFIESDRFLNNFEKVSLKSFSTIGDTRLKENYDLSFTGKFIQINEAKN